MVRSRELVEMLATAPPALPVEAVAHAVGEQFGLRGHYTPLVGERDQNFRLRARDGRQYVVKIGNPEDAAAVGGYQVDVLLHLSRVSTVPVPEVIASSTGKALGSIERDGLSYPLRVVSYLDAELLASVELGPDLAADFGERLARLDLDLATFEVAGASPGSPWDMQRAAELDALLRDIDDPAVRALVGSTIDRFATTVLPSLERLPRQAIHGDANPENVLVTAADRRVSGFIDFGDSVLAPRIVDVAIAASYLRAPASDPARLVRPFLQGYEAITPLTETERPLLADLVRTRLATTIAILYWRSRARDPEDAYRQKTLRTEAGAIEFLELMSAGGGIELLSSTVI